MVTFVTTFLEDADNASKALLVPYRQRIRGSTPADDFEAMMETTGTPPKKPLEVAVPPTPAELELLAWVERVGGEKLTQQQAHLAIEQARALGEL